MVTVVLDGKKILCPGCYEELTTGAYQRAILWDTDQPDIAKRDFFKLFSLITGTDFNIKPTHENDVTIWNAIGWYVTQPFQFSTKLPAVLEIGEKKIIIPKKLGALGSGQNILLRQAIDKSTFMEENISIAVAICLQPLYDESKFDVDRTHELDRLIKDMPIYLTHPIGFFFLQTVGSYGRTHTKSLPLSLGNLKRNLKRMWPRLLRWKNYESLTTYP